MHGVLDDFRDLFLLLFLLSLGFLVGLLNAVVVREEVYMMQLKSEVLIFCVLRQFHFYMLDFNRQAYRISL